MTVIHKVVTATAALFALAATTMSIAFAGNDFLVAELRVDLPVVYNARDYIIEFTATGQPLGHYPDYTTAWLGTNLAQGNGQTFSDQFSQVGLLTDSQGLHWFVYAEPGVICLQGTPVWGPRGCKGSLGHIATMGNPSQVELVSYPGQGFWIARVYDSTGNADDVAKILSSGSRIYRAYSAMEQGYTTSQNQYLYASFYQSHPRYFAPTATEWPLSDSTDISSIHATDLNGQNSFCPAQYGAEISPPPFHNDPRKWWTGTGGSVCSRLLFPAESNFLPIVFR